MQQLKTKKKPKTNALGKLEKHKVVEKLHKRQINVTCNSQIKVLKKFT